ncbi:LolA family protein [Candidatus Clostridium stratigraminis]|uniref:LolA family protein n=1 Tax=Candidatus Clostridium stratigraminis TaxID=3381661 RepID=A0ABW8SZ78_9CLOT
MDNKDKETKLSSYIDSLNNEKKPIEHESNREEDDLEELLETVRKVKSLNRPSLPDDKFSERLNEKIHKELLKEKSSRNTNKRWFYGIASAAAAAMLIITINLTGPLRQPNMVYAMEQAYNGVKAYHGTLEVMETNAEGKTNIQSKLEVWADKEGRYYVKGLEGAQKDLITANDGEKKWQISSSKKEVDEFTAFPDPYRFTFEIGNEIENVRNAVRTKTIGEENVSGRAATIVEITPKGGSPYKLWIDKETKMPLQKQSALEFSLQYKVLYTNISFMDALPKELLSFNIPQGYKELKSNTELVVNNLEESKALIGFSPKEITNIPSSYIKTSTAVFNNNKSLKINYVSTDNKKKVSILQQKAVGELKPASMASLGSINNSTAEVQSPIEAEEGVLLGGGAYTGVTGLSSVRWQQEGFEYAIVGNVSLVELTQFVKGLTNGTVQLSSSEQSINKPKVEVKYDLKVEEADQKSVDAGHSPWKLDPIFVSQVFVSLKISPEGITGDYPIKYEELKMVKNNGKEAVVEVNSAKSPVKRVYLKRLIRQDNTGIWTVVGYDPAK